MDKRGVEHLEFLIDRLVGVYGESPNADFIVKGREILRSEKADSEAKVTNIGVNYAPINFG